VKWAKTARIAAKIGGDSGRRGPNYTASRSQRPFFPRAGDFFAAFLVDFFVPFFFADFNLLAAVALFFTADLFEDDDLPPPKIAVQLSANFFVAPTRTLLIAKLSPDSDLKSCRSGRSCYPVKNLTVL
jgi:hypothetical protein